MSDAKTRLAKAALKQVPKHGWTQDAIAFAAAEDPKLSLSMSGMLTATELVGWFMDDMNEQLKSKKFSDNNNKQFEAIQWRLQQVLPFVESGQWHKGMAMGLSTPLKTRAQLHEFIELVSPANSSQAYQTALGAIFVATELHLLTDSSSTNNNNNNYQDTWTFLQTRLDELEAHQQQYGDVDPAQFLAQLASTAPFPSLTSLANNMTNSIPVVAGLAVAQSLVEGAASLVFPKGMPQTTTRTTTTTTATTSSSSTTSLAGTKASDYKSPSDDKTNFKK